MITESNYQLLKKAKEVKLEEEGFCTKKEVEILTEILQLNEMDKLQLQNLRDLTVAMWGMKSLEGDKMSAITAIIDGVMFEKL